MSDTVAPGRAPVSLRRYWTVLVERWRVVGIGAVAGLVLAGGYLLVAGQTYTAHVDLNINVITSNPFDSSSARSDLLDAATEVDIAESQVVAVRASEQLDGSPTALRRNVEAIVSSGTVMRVSFSADTAAAATAGAEAFADAYLAYRSEDARSRVQTELGAINDRIEQLRNDLVDANDRQAESEPGSAQYSQALSDQDLIEIELNTLLGQRTDLQTIDTAGGAVLTEASENQVDVGPSRTLTLAAGVLAGLVLGAVVAFVLDRRDRRLRTPHQVQHATGLAPIATLPDGEGRSAAVRIARERIIAALPPVEQGPLVLAVLDLTAHTAPVAAADLSLAFAASGRQTRLVLPRLARETADVLTKRLSLPTAARRASGRTSATSAPRAGGARVSKLESMLSVEIGTAPERALDAVDDAEVVVLALPADADIADRLAVTRHAIGFVEIVRLGVTTADALAAEIDELVDAGGRFVGAVLDDLGSADGAAASASRGPSRLADDADDTEAVAS